MNYTNSDKTLIIVKYITEKRKDGKRVEYLMGPTGRFKPVRPNNGLLPAYARLLIEEGYPPDSVVYAYRNQTLVFNPATLEYWADLTVSEGDHSAKLIKYQKYPEDLHDQESD